jgi:hypothetical protein
LQRKKSLGIKIIAIILIGLGIFDLIYGTITSTFILMPLTFTYVAIGWIVAVLAIITGAGLWQLNKWAYWMGMLFGTFEILLALLDVLFSYSGFWEQYMFDMFGVTLQDIGYTHGSFVTDSIINTLPFFFLCSLFLIALWKMKPLLFSDPSKIFLDYLKVYNRISISDMAQKTGLTQADVELMALDLAAKGEPIEIDLKTRELLFKTLPPAPT